MDPRPFAPVGEDHPIARPDDLVVELGALDRGRPGFDAHHPDGGLTTPLVNTRTVFSPVTTPRV